MSRWRSEVLGLAVSAHEALLAKSQGGAWVPVLHCRGDWPSTLKEVGAFIQSLPARQVRLQAVIGHELCQHWLCVPPPGVQSLAELMQFARLRREQIHGDGVDEPWRVMADWQVAEGFPCVAMPASLVDTLHSLASGRVGWLGLQSAVMMQFNACRSRQPRAPWHSLLMPDCSGFWSEVPGSGLVDWRCWTHAPDMSMDERVRRLCDEVRWSALRQRREPPTQWLHCVVAGQQAVHGRLHQTGRFEAASASGARPLVAAQITPQSDLLALMASSWPGVRQT